MPRYQHCFVLGLTATSLAAAAQTRPPNQLPGANERVIELRVARSSAAPGYGRMQVAGNATTAYVSQGSLVDDLQIARVRAHRRGGALTVDLLLTPDGASRLREATRTLVGQHLAVLIGSRLATSVPVVTPLSLPRGRLSIGLKVDERTASEFAAKITSRWPLSLPGPGEKE